MDGVLIDLTELMRQPQRTGIQRVERELIRHWPGPARLVPCWLPDSRPRFVTLPDAVLDLLTQDAPQADGPAIEAERRALAPLLAAGRPLAAPAAGFDILNPELFYEHGRAEAYLHLAATGVHRISWLLFDFLPWLRPELVKAGWVVPFMHYLRALRAVRRVGFISEATRTEFHTRIRRGTATDGPVFPLGGDGLNLERQHFSPDRQDFVVLGTIDPRKNVAAVIAAFEPLWAAGCPARLILAGKLYDHTDDVVAALARLRDEPRLRHLEQPSDAAIRSLLRTARALIFASRGEGFGIPPIEALHAGIPVIASADIPSIAALPPAGLIRLPDPGPESIGRAVRRMLHDPAAAALWADAATQTVGTWRQFAGAVANWVQFPEGRDQ
ncbi:MAG TPA: glycosyltransferase [Acetobacteraceae bacterium]|nr:glycosyltransferase [Acetobacteraceae bacterium]